MKLFLPDGDHVPAAGKGRPEKGGQRCGDALHILLPVILREPDDVVEGVVQKMRIDLGLQKLELQVPQIDLLLAVAFHQVPQALRHPVEATAQGPDLRAAGFPGPGTEIPGADLPGRFDQVPDRPRDTVDHPGCQKERDHKKGKGRQEGEPGQEHPPVVHLPPDVLHAHRLVIDIFRDPLLDHLRDHADVHVEPFHVLIVVAGDLHRAADVIHPLMQRDQELGGALDALQGVRRDRRAPHVFKGFLRVPDHLVRVGHAKVPLDLVFAQGMGHHHVHDGIHILLEDQVIRIDLGDVLHDGVVGITDLVDII